MTRPLDALAAALTLALCVVWGFNQVIAKVALADVGPIAQTGVRSALGVVCVVAYALAAKRRAFIVDGSEAAGALAGVLFTAEFIVLYESLRFTTAARATVFIYAAPFFVALGAALVLRSERLTPLQWLGLALAFLGVALGMMGRSAGGGAFGDALALIAAALRAATTILIRATRLRRADPRPGGASQRLRERVDSPPSIPDCPQSRNLKAAGAQTGGRGVSQGGNDVEEAYDSRGRRRGHVCARRSGRACAGGRPGSGRRREDGGRKDP